MWFDKLKQQEEAVSLEMPRFTPPAVRLMDDPPKPAQERETIDYSSLISEQAPITHMLSRNAVNGGIFRPSDYSGLAEAERSLFREFGREQDEITDFDTKLDIMSNRASIIGASVTPDGLPYFDHEREQITKRLSRQSGIPDYLHVESNDLFFESIEDEMKFARGVGMSWEEYQRAKADQDVFTISTAKLPKLAEQQWFGDLQQKLGRVEGMVDGTWQENLKRTFIRDTMSLAHTANYAAEMATRLITSLGIPIVDRGQPADWEAEFQQEHEWISATSERNRPVDVPRFAEEGLGVLGDANWWASTFAQPAMQMARMVVIGAAAGPWTAAAAIPAWYAGDRYYGLREKGVGHDAALGFTISTSIQEALLERLGMKFWWKPTGGIVRRFMVGGVGETIPEFLQEQNEAFLSDYFTELDITGSHEAAAREATYNFTSHLADSTEVILPSLILGGGISAIQGDQTPAPPREPGPIEASYYSNEEALSQEEESLRYNQQRNVRTDETSDKAAQEFEQEARDYTQEANRPQAAEEAIAGLREEQAEVEAQPTPDLTSVAGEAEALGLRPEEIDNADEVIPVVETEDDGLVLVNKTETTGSTVEQVTAELNRAYSAGAVEVVKDIIRVVQSVTDLPEALQKRGVSTSGAYHNGVVYLVADGIDPASDSVPRYVANAILHHEVVHSDSKNIFGSDKRALAVFGQFMKATAQQYSGKGEVDTDQHPAVWAWLQAQRDARERGDASNLAEESVAYYLQHEQVYTRDPGLKRKIIAQIKKHLVRVMGPRAARLLTNDDIAAIYISAVRQKMRRAGRKPAHPLSVFRDPKFSAAYHGTRVRGIKTFDTKYIGTGEGAQAYGYGLYFASKEEVAEWYRENLTEATPDVYLVDGERVEVPELGFLDYDLYEEAYANALEFVSRQGYEGALFDINRWRNEQGQFEQAYDEALYNAVLALEGKTVEKLEPEKAGQVYKVEVPEDDVLLDWDKPLSEQPEKVKEVLGEISNILSKGNENRRGGIDTGRDAYNSLVEAFGIPGELGGLRGEINGRRRSQAASEYLNSLGIKGIKYADGMSRNKGKDSYNYVIFQGEDVQVVGTKYSTRDLESNAQKRYNIDEIKASLTGEDHDYIETDSTRSDRGQAGIDDGTDARTEAAEQIAILDAVRLAEHQTVTTIAQAQEWLRRHKFPKIAQASESVRLINRLLKNKAFRSLSIFDQIRIAAQLERPVRAKDYSPKTAPKANKKLSGQQSIRSGSNQKVAGSGILAADTVAGCDHFCYECYALKGAAQATISHQHPVKVQLNGTMKKGELLRIGEVGDPSRDWSHTHQQIAKIIERSQKRGQDVSADDVFYITKLLNLNGFNPETAKNIQVTLDPLYPDHMLMSMQNILRLKSAYPETNISARIRSIHTKNADLNSAAATATAFANRFNIPVLETRMRFIRKGSFDLLELDPKKYKRVGNQYKMTEPALKEDSDKYHLCDAKEASCPACKNCIKLTTDGKTNVPGQIAAIKAAGIDGLSLPETQTYDPVGFTPAGKIPQFSSRGDYTEEDMASLLGATPEYGRQEAGRMPRPSLSDRDEYDQMINEADRRVKAILQKKFDREYKKAEYTAKQVANNMVKDHPIPKLYREGKASGGINLPQLKVDYDKNTTNELVRKFPGLFLNKGAMSPDEFAADNGYESLDQMVEELKAYDKDKVYDRAFNDVMLEANHWQNRYEEEQYEILHAEEMSKQLARLSRGNRPARNSMLKAVIEQEIMGKNQAERMISETEALEASMKKAQQASRKAYSAGKKDEAFRLNEIYRARLQKVRAQRDLKNRHDKNLRALKKISKRKTMSKGGILPEQYKLHIEGLLVKAGIISRKNMATPATSQLHQFLVNESEEYNVDTRVLQEMNLMVPENKPWGQMTQLERDALTALVTGLDSIGRSRGKLHKAAKGAEIEQIRNDLLIALHEGIGMDRYDNEVNTWFQKLRSEGREFMAEHKRPAFIFSWLDGFKDHGPWQDAVYEPFQEAQNRSLELRRQYHDDLKELLAPFKAQKGWANESYTVNMKPGQQRTFSKLELIMVALNSAHDDNIKGLEATGFDRQGINDALALLSQEEWELVEGIWDLLDSLYPLLNDAYKTLYGSDLPRVSGTYFPLVWDRNNPEVRKMMQQAEAEDMFAADYSINPAARQGFIYMRKPGNKFALDLDFSVVTGHLRDTIHFATHQVAISDARKIIGDNVIAGGISGAIGAEHYEQIIPWLRHIARPYSESLGRFEKILGGLRRNSAVVGLGANLGVMLKQHLSYTQTVDQVGGTIAGKNWIKWWSNPRKYSKWVWEMSPTQRARWDNIDHELQRVAPDLTGQKSPKQMLGQFQDLAFIGIKVVDLTAAVPTWMAGFEQAQELFPGDINKQILHADKVVERTQPANQPKDKSEAARSRGAKAIFYMFYGFMSVAHNRMAEMFTRARFMGPQAWGQTMRGVLWNMIVPVIGVHAINEMWGSLRGWEDDDDDPLWADLIKETLAFGFVGIPIARDIVSSFDYQVSPIGSGMTYLQWLMRQEEIDERTFWNAFMVSGYVAGLPTGGVKSIYQTVKHAME